MKQTFKKFNREVRNRAIKIIYGRKLRKQVNNKLVPGLDLFDRCTEKVLDEIKAEPRVDLPHMEEKLIITNVMARFARDIISNKQNQQAILNLMCSFDEWEQDMKKRRAQAKADAELDPKWERPIS